MSITIYHIQRPNSEEDRERYLNIIMMPSQSLIKESVLLNEYKKIAKINTNDLNKAYELSNSIENYWGENKEVVLYEERNRSSSIGDIFIKNDKVYFVNVLGFEQLSDEILMLLKNEKEQIKPPFKIK